MKPSRKTGKTRTKSGTFTVVASIESASHLDPKSWRHEQDKRYAAAARSLLAQMVALDLTPGQPLGIPSAEGGFILDGNGTEEMEGPSFTRLLCSVRSARSTYVSEETKKDGTLYERRRRTEPIKQLAISFFPAHSLFFDFLEREGIPTKPLIKVWGKKLRDELARYLPCELLAVTFHPEEGVLHFHFIFSTVSADNRLLIESKGRGRPAIGFLGIGVVGTKRLVDFGIWPDADGVGVDAELQRRKAGRSASPALDLILSETLDGMVEKFVSSHPNNPAIQKAYRCAMESYTAFARERRAHRADVLEKTVADRAAELAAAKLAIEAAQKQVSFWREKAEQAQTPAPPDAPETLSPEVVQAALFRVTAAVAAGEAPTPDAAGFFDIASGKIEISKTTMARLTAREAQLKAKAQHAEAAVAALKSFRSEIRPLQSALTNARKLLGATHPAPSVTKLQPDQEKG